MPDVSDFPTTLVGIASRWELAKVRRSPEQAISPNRRQSPPSRAQTSRRISKAGTFLPSAFGDRLSQVGAEGKPDFVPLRHRLESGFEDLLGVARELGR